MKTINLYTFTRIQQDYLTEYENLLSQRETKKKVKVHEFETLRKFVELLQDQNVEIFVQEGFFYSFKIEQIGKEFDLLKIDKDKLVLNIELKSELIEEEKIKKQLEQNYYYLRHLASDIKLFTFIGETQEIYEYIDGDIIKVTSDVLIDVMNLFASNISEGIETLFEAKKYLISPLNTPKEFLQGQYFLTQQQKCIKEKVLSIVSDIPFILGITGKAGTGKTLLLYDIANTIARLNNKCCVIHSGILSEGHNYLNDKWSNVSVISAKDLNGDSNLLYNYDFIFVDEAQRIYDSTVNKITKMVFDEGKGVIFAYDFGQALSHAEEKRNIPDMLRGIEGFQEYSLTEKVRTNKEVASFYRTLLDLKDRARTYINYSNIDVLYADNIVEALQLIDLYKEMHGYVFISYTQSIYNHSSIDIYPNEHDTHHVIGQEYDKVIIVVDDNFRYDEDGRIQCRIHPNPDYRFYKLLYQGVSRAREKLCILVVNNYTMFKQISDIKYQMLEKCQYKDNVANSIVHPQKLNDLTKKIKDVLIKLESDDAETVDDAIDTVSKELLEVEPREKLIRSEIKLLNMILQKNKEKGLIILSIQDYINYISTVI